MASKETIQLFENISRLYKGGEEAINNANDTQILEAINSISSFLESKFEEFGCWDRKKIDFADEHKCINDSFEFIPDEELNEDNYMINEEIYAKQYLLEEEYGGKYRHCNFMRGVIIEEITDKIKKAIEDNTGIPIPMLKSAAKLS